MTGVDEPNGIGLPRQIPADSPGVTIRGQYYPPGTVLSVPTYTIHHSKEIWGPDADEFRPERWIENGGLTDRQKNAFIPFSYGPRACVGRNVAEMEMKMIAATITSMVDGVNMRLEEVAQLNNRISAIEAAGQDANSDRDRRDLLLKELSGIIGASTFETSNGTATVQLGNGMPLVEGTQVTRIQAVASGVDTNLELAFGTTTLPLGRSALGGEFGGLYQARDVMIPDVVNRLDQLAFTFANSINAQHQAGTGLDGVGGRDFFVAPVAVAGSASSLSMSITATAELAAGASISPGDNTNALAILQLEQQQLLGNDTFVSYYGKIAATVGVETARNRQAKQGFEDSLIQLQNLRDGLDGVSIEDEMINLLQYQKGFEASAKFLSTVDEMMDTLLTLKR